ncbi:MAG: WD40 repeat domain-containing protein, partial [Polyangiaceae bacterium]|nr:WD40 repeat domain-containing protein [Polyangiaceae bacterium]
MPWTVVVLALPVCLVDAPINAQGRHDDFCSRQTTQVVGGKTGDQELLATGQCLTPTAAPGAVFERMATGLRPDGNADADGAYTSALSPDGNTLLVLTNGYNASFFTTAGQPITFPYLDPLTGLPSDTSASSFQWIFVYDVSSGTPIKTQQINIPSAYAGLAWDPSGSRFYASGGQEDRIYIYKYGPTGWEPDAPFALLNHNSNAASARPNYDGEILASTPAGQSTNGKLYGLVVGAMTVGVAVSADGRELYAVNMQNDSVSIVDAHRRQVIREVHLFNPGETEAKGEYPMWVTPHTDDNGATDKLYVSSQRDGQIVVVS